MRDLDPKVIGEKHLVDICGMSQTQISVLFALRQHGFWSERGCGWYWNHQSGTKRFMEALMKRGLVAKGTYRKFIPHSATRTNPTWDKTDDAYLLTAGGAAFLMAYELAEG